MALKTLKPRLATIEVSRLRPPPAPSNAPTYRIRGHRLQAIREQHLRAHPLCVHCEQRGLVTVATELDHIVALTNGGTDTDDNRQGLCADCHAVKTKHDLRVIRRG